MSLNDHKPNDGLLSITKSANYQAPATADRHVASSGTIFSRLTQTMPALASICSVAHRAIRTDAVRSAKILAAINASSSPHRSGHDPAAWASEPGRAGSRIRLLERTAWCVEPTGRRRERGPQFAEIPGKWETPGVVPSATNEIRRAKPRRAADKDRTKWGIWRRRESNCLTPFPSVVRPVFTRSTPPDQLKSPYRGT